MEDRLAADSRRLKQHPPAARKAQESVKVAKGPPNEKAAGARAKQVDKLDAAETPRPQTASFLSILQAAIARLMPKSLGDTEKFMQGGSSEAMKGSLKGNVDQQKQASTADLKQTSGQAPSEAGVAVKPVTPIPPEPAPAAPQVNVAAAMPPPRPAAEVSLDASRQDVAAQMQEEKLTDERLRKANHPAFSAVLTSRDAVNRQAATGPARFRAAEGATLGRAAAQAVGVAARGVSTLLAVNKGSKAKVRSGQDVQREKEEKELAKFTGFVSATFEAAKKAVEGRLELLETRVNDLFDKGVDAALASMKKFVEDQLYRYKLDRYLLQVGGALLWIRDQFLDLPPDVNRFYTAGRERFTRDMNALAVRVADLVESQLKAAKNDVKQAQAKIAREQKALSPAVQARGAAKAAEYAEKFSELESGIEDKKQQLAEGLAQKYKEAFDKADESLKAIQEENKGLVTRAKEAIGEVLKALAEFKAKLMGILRKGADAMDLILADPIQFLSNLIAAIKQGFSQFSSNIEAHLKAGFLKWLIGSLGKLGIEVPKDLTLPSILKLVLGVLGITYARMREKAVRLVGERAVGAVEKVVEAVGVLIKGGPAALWEHVKEGLSNLKEMVIDAMQEWLITTIVKRATAKIVSLFNPVGAIIAAVMLIVDVVTFVVTKAAQILEFVDAVVSSVASIARGAVGAAASWIEKSLANMIPLLIGFLASLLGLSGVTEKIKELIKKVQGRVDRAIDKVIAKIVGGVKKLIRTGVPQDPKQRLRLGMEAATAAVRRLPGNRIGRVAIVPVLAAIRVRYGFQSLEPFLEGQEWWVRGRINPDAKAKTGKRNESREEDRKGGGDPEPKVAIDFGSNVVQVELSVLSKRFVMTHSLQRHHYVFLSGRGKAESQNSLMHARLPIDAAREDAVALSHNLQAKLRRDIRASVVGTYNVNGRRYIVDRPIHFFVVSGASVWGGMNESQWKAARLIRLLEQTAISPDRIRRMVTEKTRKRLTAAGRDPSQFERRHPAVNSAADGLRDAGAILGLGLVSGRSDLVLALNDLNKLDGK